MSPFFMSGLLLYNVGNVFVFVGNVPVSQVDSEIPLYSN